MDKGQNMDRGKALAFSAPSYTTSFVALGLISIVSIWHLAQNLPFETPISPGAILSVLLGLSLAMSVLLASSLIRGRILSNNLILAGSFPILAITEYLVSSHDFDWTDPYIAAAWIMLGTCLSSSRVAGPMPNSARLCFAVGIGIEVLELARSIVVNTVYGGLSQGPLLQWYESGSDLLMRTAYIIGVVEVLYFRAVNQPENASFGTWTDRIVNDWLMSPLLAPALSVGRKRNLAKFRAENPQAQSGEYYASLVIRRIDEGQGHPTLGKRQQGFKFPFMKRPHRAGEFSRQGVRQFEFIKQAGLQQNHICADYGCGSLRIGQHLIRFLDLGRYWGLDVVDRFFRDGYDLLPQELKNKAPNLRVISPATLTEAERAAPDFVICFAVLTHVPPEELDAVIERIMRLAKDKATVVLSFREAEAFIQRGTMNFTHRRGLIEQLILAHRPNATFNYHRERKSNKRMAEWETFLEVRPLPEEFNEKLVAHHH